MKTLFKYIFILILTISFSYCSEDTPTVTQTKTDTGKWLIPKDEVYDGGPGRDGIPALDKLQFNNVENTNYLQNSSLVIAINIDNEIRVYPHAILDWHEIINDAIGNNKFAITYCPLTGSGIGWNRIIDGEATTFGVSGLLYNTNLIPYDRKTGSNWSQMKLQSVNGPLISKFVSVVPIVETSWATIKSAFPNAKVVSTNTGYSRNYEQYPYGDYRTNNSSLLFPVDHKDNRVLAKNRVLGIFDGEKTKAYQIVDFSSPGEILIDKFNSKRFLVYGNIAKNIIVAFDISNLDSTVTFKILDSDLPWIFKDSGNIKYNLFGISANSNIKLKPAKSFISYWFAWAAFYPNTDLYER